MNTQPTGNDNNLLKGYSMLLVFAGSMFQSEPPEECVNGMAESGMLKTLPVRSGNPDFCKAAALLRVACDDKLTCYERLRDDFRSMFGNGPGIKVPPYESVYRDGEGLLFGNSTLQVREAYYSNGWRASDEGKVPDDHISTQIQFITLMIDNYLGAKTDKKEHYRIPLLKFLREHPLTWIDQWVEGIEKHGSTRFYKGAALLIKASIEDIADMLDTSEGGS